MTNGATLPVTGPFVATRNACKLCTPLGACLAFAGVEGARTILHGSQGCATYIRRYMISHFKEPVDIASSNFSESATIFGGRDNLKAALANVVRQYQPGVIGVATTCLAETIGEDVKMYLHEIRSEPSASGSELPPIVHVATPSYCGTHAEGFAATVRALVAQMAKPGPRGEHVNVFAGMFSPADLRYLKEIFTDFQLPATLLPDYSETLDGPTWEEFELIPRGGTPLEAIRRTGRAKASIEFTHVQDAGASAAHWLEQHFAVPAHRLPLPIGITASDALFDLLETLSGRMTPDRHAAERGRLIDSLVDGHKYLFDRRAVVFGEEDLVAGIVGLLCELGVRPVLCASGGHSGRLQAAIQSLAPEQADSIQVCQATDFADLEELAGDLRPDLLIGNSKGYWLARRLKVPLVRIGFPIHDRVGGARLLHIGYRGAQQLADRITNTLLESIQEESDVGYSYL
jgi:nitrogenase molybdenum-iron protein NifN